MTVVEYLESVGKRYEMGVSQEPSYRGDLEELLRSLSSNVEITNEPKNVTDCGSPDYVIMRGKIPVGFIEAKDIGKDLDSPLYKEQFTRYKEALDNLIITDYLYFRFYLDGEIVNEIRIGDVENGKIIPKPDMFNEFENHIKEFCSFTGQTIKSSNRLATLMAGKARLLENILEKAVISDEETNNESSLKEQFKTFQDVLIHDLSPHAFADIYAQTITYGMFAARLHASKLENFNRDEAASLVPKTNPFLRNLFQHLAGYNIDERIRGAVDSLADVFRATDVSSLLRDFGKDTQTTDPVIHFYETFLMEYNPKLRKNRGVYYTPEPIVDFMVRAVDNILKSDFDITMGLADTSKIKIKRKIDGTATQSGKDIYEEIDVHRVQILDPATGTGTFLAKIIEHIYSEHFSSMKGAWSTYVDEHLIPRLHGFEILMASYAMAHLKMDMLLEETGHTPKKNQRFNIYLTNSLEEEHPDTGSLFATWLSTEANSANRIKRDAPVMIVIGNPPYANFGQMNKGEWIKNLIADYKKDLNETKLNLDDDYIKFIRYGQYLIEKNGEGILAYISNNSFLDGITHRQMRKTLMNVFDKIYILNLHGDAKKKETAPDGSKDENVFKIMQGVSINIFIKLKTPPIKKTEIFYADKYGLRQKKYKELLNDSVKWKTLKTASPDYFFTRKNTRGESKYNRYLSVSDLFAIKSDGIETQKDSVAIQFSKKEMRSVIEDFISLEDYEIKLKYKVDDGRDWKVVNVKNEIVSYNLDVEKIHYRSFDFRYTVYIPDTNGFIAYPRKKVMNHVYKKNNLCLCFTRTMPANQSFNRVFVTNYIADKHIISDRTYISPLYLYTKAEQNEMLDNEISKKPNLNMVVVNEIAGRLKLQFTEEKEEKKNNFAPIDILDYIYAVLHSPKYREKYDDLLKVDFPRVPYPEIETFWTLVEKGREIRELHLLEHPSLRKPKVEYPVSGENLIEKIEYSNGKVFINEMQYFDGVAKDVWSFYIGGYQPAQKWLKDRKGRKLDFEEITHYRMIIQAINQTILLMNEIDDIIKID